jgi:hypothetical protein
MNKLYFTKIVCIIRPKSNDSIFISKFFTDKSQITPVSPFLWYYIHEIIQSERKSIVFILLDKV